VAELLARNQAALTNFFPVFHVKSVTTNIDASNEGNLSVEVNYLNRIEIFNGTVG
jgi:hypothetical protein